MGRRQPERYFGPPARGGAPLGGDCGKWLRARGFWQGRFGLRQAAQPATLTGAFWQGGPQGVRHRLSPLCNRKGRPRAAFFFFYSITSEYQIERINWPKYIEGIRV